MITFHWGLILRNFLFIQIIHLTGFWIRSNYSWFNFTSILKRFILNLFKRHPNRNLFLIFIRHNDSWAFILFFNRRCRFNMRKVLQNFCWWFFIQNIFLTVIRLLNIMIFVNHTNIFMIIICVWDLEIIIDHYRIIISYRLRNFFGLWNLNKLGLKYDLILLVVFIELNGQAWVFFSLTWIFFTYLFVLILVLRIDT